MLCSPVPAARPIAVWLAAACVLFAHAPDAVAPAAHAQDNSCRWAFDGECDEPVIGTGACDPGTDTADCAPARPFLLRSDTCAFAFDGVCDEPGIGTGRCPALTDTADCFGRNRPREMRDHFFGHDDRFLPPSDEMPWRAIGIVDLPDGSCTGVLVAPHVVMTSAHCLISSSGGHVKPLTFRAGASGDDEAGIAGFSDSVVSPTYARGSAPPGMGNGTDWAILRLDRPLGDEVGYLEVHALDAADLRQIEAGGLRISQAGYSWDTDPYLSGHRDCRVILAYRDNSILHNCDTTRGDSGSPLLLFRDGRWQVIALDSQFFAPQPVSGHYSSSHLAVDSRAFADALQEYLARNP